ncbi:MAG: glycine oxidase [Patiriisocius sp.]
MKNVDYIVVGLGIGGLTFSKTLLEQDKSFVVIDSGIQGATKASGGVLNPTVLKRFTAAWNSAEFISKAFPFYKSLAKEVSHDVLYPTGIHRILASVEEQNNWMVASDKEALSGFLSSEILKNNNSAIVAPFGLGAVQQAQTIKPLSLLKLYQAFLKKKGLYIEEHFKHDLLLVTQEGVKYKDILARKIVFAEGAGVVYNPYFTVPISPEGKKVFVGNKGEYIIIKAPTLKSEAILKGPVMIIPLGDDLYKVGASYGRDDFSMHTTAIACEEISEKLRKMISCDFVVVDQVTGIRPTVKDRKPLVGSLQEDKIISFLNGLGARGLTMAPLLAEHLFNYLEHDRPLPKIIDIKRFIT